ncbi:glycosyltransferase [Paenibacillus typhae]|uniref:glycosyltransferase n=1 Tax=Paenibacillus typhae TaxID=1174501 RepID=UPI001C8E76DE|nr:glycosyltransferase [Paenibacillus typhae]MBY0013625.1 glycosyltransferase [Paenibacillus typhae]
MFKYAGVVVLYNPALDVKDNIDSYINIIDKLFVIDNSNLLNASLIDTLCLNQKIEYVSLNGNQGLAKALKIGCERARDEGFDYVLTMDQDSYFKGSTAKYIIDFIEKSKEHYAMIASNAISIYEDEKTGEIKEAFTEISGNNKECNWVMTSGSMMCIKDYVMTSGIDDSLFIAHIDIDICIKLNLCGGKIIKLHKAKLYQKFGNSKPRRFLWKTVHPSFANPDRTYYIFRNQNYLEKKYPKHKSFIGVRLYKFLVKIIFFEDQKLKKLYMACIGIIDAKRGRMGKCRY